MTQQPTIIRAFNVSEPPSPMMRPRACAYIAIRADKSMMCSLPDDTPASLSYAGIKPEEIMEARIAVGRTSTPEEACAALSAHAYRGYAYEPA